MVRRTDGMTVVGVFHSQREAQEAIRDLKATGFSDQEIGLISHHDDNDHGHEARNEHGNKAGEGAAVGAATGAGVGALWAVGIAAGMLPAIGPVVAGGILGSVLASAAGGAVAAGIAGALVGVGIPEEEAEYYENEFRAGRTLVTVKGSTRRDEAQTILQRHGAYDIETGGDTSGRVTSSQTASSNRLGTGRPSTAQSGTDRTVQLREEQLRAENELKRTGEVTETQRVSGDALHEELRVDEAGDAQVRGSKTSGNSRTSRRR